MPPSVSEKQRKFFGAELGRKRAGEKTETGLSEESLRDFAKKPVEKKPEHKKEEDHKRGYGAEKRSHHGRHARPRGSYRD